MLLRRPPLPLAPPFLRNSLFFLLMGVSLKGRAIFCACGSFSRGLSTFSGVACDSSSTGSGSLRDGLRPLFLAPPSLDFDLAPFVRVGNATCPSSAGPPIDDLVLRVAPFLGTSDGSSGGGGEELGFLRVGLLDVVAGAACPFCSEGDAARFNPLLRLPRGFFTIGADAGSGSGFNSGAGGGAGVGAAGSLGEVFCLLGPRVNMKSPSSSS